MSKRQPSVAEKQLRQAVCNILPDYEQTYNFHNTGGHFVERLIKQLNERAHAGQQWLNVELRYGNWNSWLRSAIYVTLTGCTCIESHYTIPQKIRQEIEDKIIAVMSDTEEP